VIARLRKREVCHGPERVYKSGTAYDALLRTIGRVCMGGCVEPQGLKDLSSPSSGVEGATEGIYRDGLSFQEPSRRAINVAN